MSIFYIIEIETDQSLAQCQKILLQDIEHEIIETTPSEVTIRTPYFGFSLEKLATLDEAFSIELGIKPTISIWLDSIRHSNENSMPMLYKLFMRWVHTSDDTAVLLFQGERVLLLSRDGQLMLNSDKRWWRKDVDDLIDKEYDLKDFPIL